MKKRDFLVYHDRKNFKSMIKQGTKIVSETRRNGSKTRFHGIYIYNAKDNFWKKQPILYRIYKINPPVAKATNSKFSFKPCA